MSSLAKQCNMAFIKRRMRGVVITAVAIVLWAAYTIIEMRPAPELPKTSDNKQMILHDKSQVSSPFTGLNSQVIVETQSSAGGGKK